MSMLTKAVGLDPLIREVKAGNYNRAIVELAKLLRKFVTPNLVAGLLAFLVSEESNPILIAESKMGNHKEGYGTHQV